MEYRGYRIIPKGKNEDPNRAGHLVVKGTAGKYVEANVMPGGGYFMTEEGAKETIDLLIEAGANQTTGFETTEDWAHHRTVGRRFMEFIFHMQAIREDAYRTEMSKHNFKKDDKVRPKREIPLPNNDMLRPEYEYTVTAADMLPESENTFILCVKIAERPQLEWIPTELFEKAS